MYTYKCKINKVIDGNSLNQWMIDNNYAVAYQGENKELVQEAHQLNKQKLTERGELK